MDSVSKGEAEWSPAIWTAGHAELFVRFRELSDDVAVLFKKSVASWTAAASKVRTSRSSTSAAALASSSPPRLSHTIAS